MTAAAAAPMSVRVTVADAWRTFVLEAAAGETAGSLKLRALAQAHIARSTAALYEMKVGGALIRDESKPLAGLGVGNGAALVVLSGRRRAVR